MDFSRLTLRDWQQFAEVDIKFHPRATVITGSNGSGKTTILSLLAQHRGWQQVSLATPKADLKTKVLRYFSLGRQFGREVADDRQIGGIHYTYGVVATLLVPEVGGAQYQVQIQNQQHPRFFYIPSHRQTFSYRRVGQIQTARKERQTAFDEVQNNQLTRHAGNASEPSVLSRK